MNYQDDVEAHAAILSEWSGIDRQAIVKMLNNGGVDTDFTLTSKLNGLIKEEQKKIDEKKKREDEIEQKKKIQKVQELANASAGGIKEEAKVEVEVKGDEVKLEEIKVEEIKLDEVKKEGGPVDKDLRLKDQAAPKREIDEVAKRKEKEKKDRDEMISMVLELVQEDTTQTMKFELKERKKLE